MARPRHLRKVVKPPSFSGYKPFGTHLKSLQSVELLYEEYEAIKLADYDCLDHLSASKLMGISRPTFARIYDSARKKIAEALVEVKVIKSVYGNAKLDGEWFSCLGCNARFTLPNKHTNQNCPLCKSQNTEQLN